MAAENEARAEWAREDMPRALRAIVVLAFLGALLGCADMRREAGRAEAERIARQGSLGARVIPAGEFDLAAYERLGPHGGETLVVYIEGDGLAWVNRAQPADDPTPSDPVALRLAAADTARNVLYLARPCQFVSGAEARHCAPSFWLGARYSEAVVEATSHAIELVKGEAGAERLELVGYSGGGVVATLVAARRSDVARVITVAANLDLPSWTSYHHVAPLSQSLNPRDFAASLSHVKQVAFVGGRDEVVPPALIEPYRAALGATSPLVVVPVADFSHECCWAERWPALLREARALP